MKKLALAFSSKNRVDLSVQTWPRLCDAQCAAFWLDGSTDPVARMFFQEESVYATHAIANSTGGPDRTILRALTSMLNFAVDYDYIGILENDTLLDEDWFSPTLALFDNQEGLPVGAVSARSFCDRVLIQRDGYCVLHNAGAGMILFTREAAQIVLNNYRTGWWPENRSTFSQLSGIDIGKFAAFGFNEQMITADWSWDTILAAHGLATVALTPSKATMIGQDIAEQGLRLTTGPVDVENPLNDAAFHQFRANLLNIRGGHMSLPTVDHQLRTRGGQIIFPHHAAKHHGVFHGRWTTKWSQGFGPFTYVAGPGASFSIPIFGPCAFHVYGGAIKLTDAATGFETDVDLTDAPDPVTIAIPRDMQTGIIRLGFSEGARLAGIETVHPQPVWKDVSFDYSVLPETN